MSDDEFETQTDPNKGSGGDPPTRIGAGTNPQEPLSSVFCCFCKRHVTKYLPVLPFMAAYVCIDCMKDQRKRAIPASEISNKSFAPWSDREIASINEYQQSNAFLPFICSAGHTLVAQNSGLFCKSCRPQFSLSWTYPWVLNASWKQA